MADFNFVNPNFGDRLKDRKTPYRDGFRDFNDGIALSTGIELCCNKAVKRAYLHGWRDGFAIETFNQMGKLAPRWVHIRLLAMDIGDVNECIQT